MPQPPSRRVIYLSVAFHVVAPLVVFQACSAGNIETWLVAMAVGFSCVCVPAAQWVLWTSFLILGRQSWLRWLMYGAPGTLLLALYNGFSLALSCGPVVVADLALVFVCGTAPFLAGLALFAVARRFEWRWCDATVPLGPPLRFSLTHLLLATASVAAVLSVAHAVHVHIEPLSDYVTIFDILDGGTVLRLTGLAVGMFTASSLGFIAVVGPQPRLGVASAALLAAAGVGYLMWYIFSEQGGLLELPPHEMMLLTTESAVVVFGTLLFLRWGGWRIDRVEQCRVEPLPSAADAPTTSVA